MANCAVSGTFLDSSNTAISGATVSFTIEQPVLDASARLLLPKTISTTTASDGTWTLSLAQQISGIVTLKLAINNTSPTTDYNFSIITPATTTATFQSVWADANNLTPVSNLPLSFASISGTLAGSQLPTFTGDVTNVNAVMTVAAVGGSTAAAVNTATGVVNTAQSGNKVLASPSNGSSAAPAFRALVGADLPNPSSSSLGGIQSLVAVSGQWINTISTSGVPTATTPTFNDISGTVTLSQLPNITLTGDTTATLTNGTGATTAVSIGGSTATLVHAAELLANAATAVNTVSTIMKRDGSGQVAATTFTGALTGTASGNPPNARSISTTAPITGGGDLSANRTFAIAKSTTGVDGYLAAADFTIFNNKQSGPLTGDVTTSGAAATLAATQSNVTSAPNLATVGTVTSGTWSATTVALNKGGTGQTTKAAAFDALQPMTTGGDIIYGGASGTGTRLANGNAGQFLKSNGTTLAPSWAAATVTYTVPTVQKFISGTSQTYTTPANTLYIRVLGMGGGGGGGASVSGTGTSANTTTFGSFTAVGGGGGSGGGGIGGTGAGGGTGTADQRYTGADGESGDSAGTGTTVSGGHGGDSFIGGGGSGGQGGNGSNGKTNTGGGGGGGGGNLAATSGAGGGAGEYFDVIIGSPSATYTYTVGTGGAGSSGSGNHGGDGAAGIIVVYEYYQ